MKKNYFWGIILIVFGITYIIKRIFDLNFSVFSVVLATALILWGISMITKKSKDEEYKHSEDEESYQKNYSQNNIKHTNFKKEYDIIFGSSIVDLRDMPVPLANHKIVIDTVFGKSIIKINPEVPILIKSSAVFANAAFPNKSVISFGDYTYATPAYAEGFPYVKIVADVVFGTMDIEESYPFS
jgi:predicted membrane protein